MEARTLLSTNTSQSERSGMVYDRCRKNFLLRGRYRKADTQTSRHVAFDKSLNFVSSKNTQQNATFTQIGASINHI